MKIIILLVLTICLIGCAKQYVPIQYQCLAEPQLEEIVVKSGILDRNNTKKVIINHIKSWEYVEYLKAKMGCK